MAWDRFKKGVKQAFDFRSSAKIRKAAYSEQRMEDLSSLAERQQEKKLGKKKSELDETLGARRKALGDLGIARSALSK